MATSKEKLAKLDELISALIDSAPVKAKAALPTEEPEPVKAKARVKDQAPDEDDDDGPGLWEYLWCDDD